MAGLVIAVSVAGQSPDGDQLLALLKDVPELAVKKVEMNIPAGVLMRVSGISADRQGNIYVIQRGADKDPVLVFSPDGKLLRSWGKGMFTMAHSIRVDPRGNVWTVDAHTSAITKFTAEGKQLLAFSVGGIPDPSRAFCGTTDIAFGAHGHLFVTDGYCNARVIEFNGHGKKRGEWGAHGAGRGEFYVPHAIAVGPRGWLYVADRENGRIQWFTPQGGYRGVWTYAGKLYSLAFGPGGKLYASLHAGRTFDAPDSASFVVQIDPDSGKIVGKYPMWAHELAVAPDGSILPASLEAATAPQHLFVLRPES
jgi:hypothetical protein